MGKGFAARAPFVSPGKSTPGYLTPFRAMSNGCRVGTVWRRGSRHHQYPPSRNSPLVASQPRSLHSTPESERRMANNRGKQEHTQIDTRSTTRLNPLRQPIGYATEQAGTTSLKSNIRKFETGIGRPHDPGETLNPRISES